MRKLSFRSDRPEWGRHCQGDLTVPDVAFSSAGGSLSQVVFKQPFSKQRQLFAALEKEV